MNSLRVYFRKIKRFLFWNRKPSQFLYTHQSFGYVTHITIDNSIPDDHIEILGDYIPIFDPSGSISGGQLNSLVHLLIDISQRDDSVVFSNIDTILDFQEKLLFRGYEMKIIGINPDHLGSDGKLSVTKVFETVHSQPKAPVTPKPPITSIPSGGRKVSE